MKFAHVRGANISHLRSKYFTAKRFHLPKWANFVGRPALQWVAQGGVKALRYSIQGYAARGEFVPFVPVGATLRSLRLATQIPQSGMRTLRVRSLWVHKKEKTPRKDGAT